MVFGARLAEAVAAGRDGPEDTGVMGALSAAPARPSGEIPCVDIDAVITTDTDIRIDTRFDTPTADAAHADADVAKLREHLQRAMIEGAGVLRSPESLVTAAAEVRAVAGRLRAASAVASGNGRAVGELANLVTVAEALLRAAYVRQETRGAHARRDFPQARPQWRRRLIHGAAAGSGSHSGAPGAAP
jgi:L-aspartate oxidase